MQTPTVELTTISDLLIGPQGVDRLLPANFHCRISSHPGRLRFCRSIVFARWRPYVPPSNTRFLVLVLRIVYPLNSLLTFSNVDCCQFTAPSCMGAKYFDHRVSVSHCRRAYLKNRMSTLYQTFGPIFFRRRCDMPCAFRCVDDVMFFAYFSGTGDSTERMLKCI